MGNDHQTGEWAERYLAGELSQEEQKTLDEKLSGDATFATAFQDALSLIRSLQGAGREKRFRAMLRDIRQTELAEQPKQAAARTIPLKAHYWRTAAVAAGVALLTSATAGWIFTHRSRTESTRYRQLANEIENVKKSQKTILDSIKGSHRTTVAPPSADVNRSGTGFAISNNGYLVTSYHVVHDADSLYIQTRDGSYYKATLVGLAQQSDIAILQVTDRNFRFGKGELPYSFASRKAGIGARVYTLGFPQDDIVYDEGYVSSRNGFEGDSMQYRLELPAEPGQSGAPVLDNEGRIVGIITAKESQAQDVTFAVSARHLINLVRDMPRNMNIQLPQQSGKLSRLTREQQLDKLQDYTCMVLVYKK